MRFNKIKNMKIKNRKIKLITPTLLIVFCLFSFNFVIGACDDYDCPTSDKYGLSKTAGRAGMGTEVSGLPIIIGGIVGVFLSFLGVIFFVLMIYGGFMWMTARGNETQVESARKTIGNAIIGLIVVLSAYVITSLVTSELVDVTQ